MKKNWIDFKALRKQLDFAQVLKHYGVEVKAKGTQHHGFCPLPEHSGKGNSPSFSANLERGIFQCFGCGAKGNSLDFAVLMENEDPKDGGALVEIAAKLQKTFGLQVRAPEDEPEVKTKREVVEQKPPTVVNQPLDFELQGLDTEHPYLLDRGFTRETIEMFGLGYCARGMLKCRIAIPLHDSVGKLIGYAGRVVDDKTINDENPRYRFPGERKRDGITFEFRKTLFLYNGYRIKAPVDDLIVVEGFTGLWWLDQNGLSNVVATMGADCSERQTELIVASVKPSGMVWIMPDGDTAGLRHAQTLLTLISPQRAMRWLKLADGKQPTDLSGKELKTRFIQ